MNTYKNNSLLQITKTVMISMVLLAMNSSCKNEKEEEPVDELPEFETCKPVLPEGRLSQSVADSTITYITSGGGTIKIDRYRIIISHKDYPNLKMEFWGEKHENLNGKHIKDWEGDRRSFIFPDDAKITMISNSGAEPFNSLTIYDGNQCHHINTSCNSSSNTLEYSSANSAVTKRLDDAESDGETGTFEITPTGLLFYNIYTETIPGKKVEKEVLLGELTKDKPSQVKDYYDDLRLAHT